MLGRLLAALVVLAPAPAMAQSVLESTARTDPPPKEPPPPGARLGTAIGGAREAWSPRWEYRVGLADYVLVGTGMAVAIGATIRTPSPGTFQGGIWFDDDARDALRLSSLDDRYRIRDASDVGVSLLTTWPILLDSLVFAWWYRGNSEVARNMAVVHAQVLSLVAATHAVTTSAVGRERPFGADCGGDLPAQTYDCEAQFRYRSFFSGHASQSFASAGVICVNHLGMGLLGAGLDALTCATATTVAAATATFRVMADLHYASDVLVGAAIGTAMGVTIPLIHGRRTVPVFGKLRLVPHGAGLGVGGDL